MRPLGQKQLRLLMRMSSPSLVMLGPTEIAHSLAARGLLEAYRNGAGLRINPAGLRALADAYEAGALDQFMQGDPPDQHEERGET